MVKEKLDEILASELTDLKGCRFDEAETTEKVDNIVKLHRMRMDEINSENEAIKAEKERKDQTQDRILKNVLGWGGIIVPFVGGMVFMNRGFKFEETGTYGSSTFKWLQTRLPFVK